MIGNRTLKKKDRIISDHLTPIGVVQNLIGTALQLIGGVIQLICADSIRWSTTSSSSLYSTNFLRQFGFPLYTTPFFRRVYQISAVRAEILAAVAQLSQVRILWKMCLPT